MNLPLEHNLPSEPLAKGFSSNVYIYEGQIIKLSPRSEPAAKASETLLRIQAEHRFMQSI